MKLKYYLFQPFIGLIGGLLALPAAAVNYNYTTINPPNYKYVRVTGINDNGELTGHYDKDSSRYGFIYKDGVFTTLSPLKSKNTVSLGINASGEVVGSFYNGQGYSGFLYSKGNYTILNADANSINNSGKIAGDGYVYSKGSYTSLNAPGSIGGTHATSINNSGQIAGWYKDATGYRGFVESEGAFTTLTGPGNSPITYARSINDSGQVAGQYYIYSEPNRPTGYGFMYSHCSFTTLSFPGSTFTGATAINANGQVTGVYDTGFWTGGIGSYKSFVYSDGSFTSLSVPGSSYTYALGINVRGQVVGEYGDIRGVHGFIATPVPEPEEYLLMLLGFGMVGYQVKRKMMKLNPAYA